MSCKSCLDIRNKIFLNILRENSFSGKLMGILKDARFPRAAVPLGHLYPMSGADSPSPNQPHIPNCSTGLCSLILSFSFS